MSLLDADFVRELEVLKRHLELRARSGQAGNRVAPRRGSSTEFADHRHYVPGDDLRRIDWLAFARSRQPMLKQYRSEEDNIARVLLDHSKSMASGVPPKLQTAKKLAGALAYLWLSAGLRFQLVGNRQRPEQASDAKPSLRFHSARRGKRSVAATFREIEAADATGNTDLSGWIGTLVATAKRPGLLVTISDFFDPGPVLQALNRARASGHEVVLVQVLAREELEPGLEGDLSLVDTETGQSLEVSIDGAALAAYNRRLLQLTNDLGFWARKAGQTYVRVSSDGDLGEAIRRIVVPSSLHEHPGQRLTHGQSPWRKSDR